MTVLSRQIGIVPPDRFQLLPGRPTGPRRCRNLMDRERNWQDCRRFRPRSATSEAGHRRNGRAARADRASAGDCVLPDRTLSSSSQLANAGEPPRLVTARNRPHRPVPPDIIWKPAGAPATPPPRRPLSRPRCRNPTIRLRQFCRPAGLVTWRGRLEDRSSGS